VNPVLYPALAEAALIIYRGARNGSNVMNPVPHLPLPSQFTSVVIVYGALSLIPASGSRFAALLGWGFVLATAFNLYEPGATVRTTNQGISPTTQPQTVS